MMITLGKNVFDLSNPNQMAETFVEGLKSGGESAPSDLVLATLTVAVQLERIADLLIETSIVTDDGTRTLFMVIHDESR